MRPGLDVDEAVDNVYGLAGTGVRGSLAHDRGWSSERYEEWLFGLACRALLGECT